MIFVNEQRCGHFQRFTSPLSKMQPVLNPSQQTQASLASADTTLQPLQSQNMSILESRKATDLSRIVFGIGAAAATWPNRKEYIKRWWRPDLRAILWLDKKANGTWDRSLPPYKISEDTSEFRYTFRGGKRSGIRITRIVSETFRLGLPDVDWFVMGDDDTFFFPDNLVKVLSKYDHNQMYYVGSVSESHIQNIYFSYNMAFGGGGFAISYPLAKALEKIQDSCLKRYFHLLLLSHPSTVSDPLIQWGHSSFHRTSQFAQTLLGLAADIMTHLFLSLLPLWSSLVSLLFRKSKHQVEWFDFGQDIRGCIHMRDPCTSKFFCHRIYPLCRQERMSFSDITELLTIQEIAKFVVCRNSSISWIELKA